MKSFGVRMSGRVPSTTFRTAVAIAAAWGAASVFGTQSASAQFSPVNTWTGNAGDGLWATTGNWSDGTSPVINGARGDDVIFNGSSALSVVLPVSPSAGRLNFNNSAGVALTGNSGGNGMQLRGGVIIDANAGSVTIAGSMNLNGNTQSYINNNPAATLTVGNVNNLNNSSVVTFTIDGPGAIVMGGVNNSGSPTPTTSLIKNGLGTVTIGSSSFRGNATLNAGSVLMPSSNSFGNTTNAKVLTINGGDINGTGASARTIGSVISVAVGGDFALNTNALATQRVNFAGTVDLGGTTRTVTVGSQPSEWQNTVSNGSIVKAGTGNLILQGNNTIGAVQINAGTISVQNNLAALGDTVSGTTVASGGELNFGAVTGTTNEPLTVGGAGPGDGTSGALTIANNANVNIASNVSLTSDTTIHATGTGTANFSGGITATGSGNANLQIRGGSGVGSGTISGALVLGTGAVTKNQSGTWNLSGNNAYTGGTTVNSGVLNANSATALGSTTGALTVSNTNTGAGPSMSVLNLFSGGATSVGSLSGTITTPGGAHTATINNPAGLNVNQSVAGTYPGAIAGVGSVTKTGSATLTLTGTNTYTGGTNVNAGTLEVRKLHAGNAVSIASGAALKILDSSPTLPAHPAGDNAFVSQPSSLTIAAGGTLDITNNDVIINYTGGPNPAADLEALVRSGFAGETWLGTGIVSSVAAQDPNYVVGIADNAALSEPFGSGGTGVLFAGVDVPLNSVLIKFTHRADLNLDGQVNFSDASIFGTNYQEGAPATWATGDVDLDGVFTFSDASIFGTFYSESLASLPEPATLGLLGLGVVSLVRRRRSA